MYFPLGWPKQLMVRHDRATLTHLSASYDHFLFAVLTQNTIGIWFCKPSVEITCLWRSQKSLAEFGTNQIARWKPDNSKLAVTTSHGYIIFYQVDVDKNVRNQTLFNQREERLRGHPDALDSQYMECIPALSLSQLFYIQIPGGVMSLVCQRDELMVSTGRGLLQRVRWSDGLLNSEMTIEVASIPFSADLQHSRSSQLNTASIYVRALHYSSLLGGFAVVLSNGRAAFITANSLKFEPHQVVGVWAQEMTQATAVAVNHKYAIIAFGSDNGEGTAYHLDEMTGALVVSHTMVISSKDFPDASQICGAVSHMRWTPEGVALALSWEKGGFSVWSVFGSLLHHSIGADAGLSDDSSHLPLTRISSMEWGSEGYHLWMITDRPSGGKNSSDTGNCQSEVAVVEQAEQAPADEVEEKAAAVTVPNLLVLQFIKSVLSMNPCMTNYTHLLLQGEDRLYLSPEESLLSMSNAANRHTAFMSPSAFVGNKQWHVLHLPHAYLAHNWPIRFASMNATGQFVALAGKCGLAHCALYARKWKLFGNETQERDMAVTGGLTWWKDFICVACFNILDQRDEIRLYPRDCKLDNTFASTVKVPSQILLLNTFVDLVIVLCADSHIVIYSIEQKNIQNAQAVSLSKVQEIAIVNFIPHPANVAAISLTSLRTDAGAARSQNHAQREAESILINVAGRLLLFQRDRSASSAKTTESSDRKMTFTAPVIVASSVENLWLYARKSHAKPHLAEALWLGCGAAGMKVWLPLQPKEDAGKSKGFLSRRIMLPFAVDIYPLAMLFEAGIILGANSEAVYYPVLNTPANFRWPYLQLERTSQVYLHHILRQLLRRNLGVHALEVARTCTDLPYFLHVMELLVHEVLEEEATSKEPIPDALLPRVVAFVEEFPEYLQTIAHCARKSDVAVWQYFFSVVGNPIDLFQECLSLNKLDTAASYLIILQNLEKRSMARQHATQLLDAALEHCSWDLARDLVRFLTAIVDTADEESASVTTTRRQRQSSTSIYPIHYPSPPVSPEDSDQFRFHASAAAVRARSVGKDDSGKDPVTKIKEKANMFIRSDPLPAVKGRHMSGPTAKDNTTSSVTSDSPEKICVESIITQHARKLLNAYRLYDLAYFAANLDDYQLVGWLRKERLLSAHVSDFVEALKKLHVDFQWPFPILSLSALKRISSGVSIESHSGCNDQISLRLSRLDVGNCPLGASTPISDQSSVNADQTSQLPDDLEAGCSVPVDHSEDSSSQLGGEADSVDSSSWSDVVGLADMEHLSAELANKGPPQSDLKLRYLFQLLVEAGCLEWAILVTVVLRDSMLFLRVVNLASLAETPAEIIMQLKIGLSAIEQWSTTDCPGYRPFLQSVQGHITVLHQCVVPTPNPQSQHRPPNLSKCHMGSSTETAAVSPATSSSVGQNVDGSNSVTKQRENVVDSGNNSDLSDETDLPLRTESDSGGGGRCAIS